jgi:ABC-type lipoprotein release transport system permease subunit
VKLINFFLLSVKYLFRYRRRYLFLFIALVFGFGIITFITSIKDGMDENVYLSAQSNYAGDIIVAGYYRNTWQGRLKKNDSEQIIKLAEKLNPVQIVKRTNFSFSLMDQCNLYFNGTIVTIEHIVGVDWYNEADYFDKLEYSSYGGLSFNDETIIVSAPVAHELGVRIGDSLTLETESRNGWKNTSTFIVGAVVDDSTIFGYHRVFVSRSALNGILSYDADDCSTIGFYISDRHNLEKKRMLLHKDLAMNFHVGSLANSREETIEEMLPVWTGEWEEGEIKIFVLTIPIYLAEVADLLNAMNLVSYFLYWMMLLIILVSAMVTNRLILQERTRELGTMRVIGFFEGDICYILVSESFSLGLISLAGGFAFALFLAWAVTFAPFSWFPSLEIFMKNGKLMALYAPKTVITNIAAAFCMIALAVWFPAWRSSRNPLPGMLAGGER